MKFALAALGLTLVLTTPMLAQEDPGEVPLGDVARNLRRKPAGQQAIIDNDNFDKVVDDAESRRASGASLLFSLDPGSKSFHVSTPDVTCSLSFSANASSLLSDPLMLDELPRSELMKLDGPATLDGDSLQVSVHNGTEWDLREVVLGLTIVRPRDVDANAHYAPGRIVPAAAVVPIVQADDSTAKRPDTTVLLRVKGSAAPSTTAIFRTTLNFALFPDQEWHWAIVKAKGIAPKGPVPAPVDSPATASPPVPSQPIPTLDRAGSPDTQSIPPAPTQSAIVH